jgi:hypothetical protein
VDRRLVLALAGLLAIVLLGGGIAVGALLLDGNPPATRGQGPPPNGPPPGDPPPPGGGIDRYTGPPKVEASQPMGDPDTHFVVYGRGWTPRSTVTVRVLGGRSSPDGQKVDRAGSFNYNVNQHHEFFPGGLPSGRLTLVVSDGAGHEDRVTVSVS